MTLSATAPELAATSVDDQRIDRALLRVVERDLERSPCALIVGPYEVGKSHLVSTLARRSQQDAMLFNGNEPSHRSVLTGDTSPLRSTRGKLIVIDEVHAVPAVLKLIRLQLELRARDHLPIGSFVLSSSRPLDARRLVSASLGTRVSCHVLMPIALGDIVPPRRLATSAAALAIPPVLDSTEAIAMPEGGIGSDMLWLRGGFPGSLLCRSDQESFAWRQTYIASLCARGFSEHSFVLSPSAITELLSRLAASQGELFTIDKSRQHHKAFLDYLDELGLVRHLRPWFTNSLKRLDKSPKVYIRDTGLLHCLQHHRSLDELRADGVAFGHSWETFCIEHLIAAAPNATPYYYRDDDQNEIDLVLEFTSRNRLAIEIKSKGSVRPGFKAALSVLGAAEGFVVRQIPESVTTTSPPAMTLTDMVSVVRSRAMSL